MRKKDNNVLIQAMKQNSLNTVMYLKKIFLKLNGVEDFQMFVLSALISFKHILKYFYFLVILWT